MNDPSSSTPSAADIAKSLSEKTKKRGKQKASPLSRSQKIPKLSNLSLSQQPNMDGSPQIETTPSFQSAVVNEDQDESQHDIIDIAEQDEEIIPKPRARRGRKKN